jgi:murein DD-endopeptidase MepM/ murein hydrolase activator NlpD
MSPRSWASRVQAALGPQKPRHGLQLARQAIIVGVGLIGTGVLLYLLFFAPMPGNRPAAPPAAIVTVNPPARDVHVPAQAQLPRKIAPVAARSPLTLQPPLVGRVLVPFGWAYSQTLEDWRLHGGISIGGDQGDDVHAAADGTVAAVARDPLWGQMVIVDDGSGVQTEYASLATATVAPGEKVAAGAVIGTVGDTATVEADLGPHLYFALVENGQAVDPAPLLAQR